MTTYRAQIAWDFTFDEKGITESEYEWRFSDEEELEGFSRTPEQMKDYAKSELLEAMFNNLTYNDLDRMIDVIEVTE